MASSLTESVGARDAQRLTWAEGPHCQLQRGQDVTRQRCSLSLVEGRGLDRERASRRRGMGRRINKGAFHFEPSISQSLCSGAGGREEAPGDQDHDAQVDHGACGSVSPGWTGLLAGCIKFRKECSRLAGARHTQFSHLRTPRPRKQLWRPSILWAVESANSTVSGFTHRYTPYTAHHPPLLYHSLITSHAFLHSRSLELPILDTLSLHCIKHYRNLCAVLNNLYADNHHNYTQT